ncbi:MFS transporter [Leifsonia aquatica]|uniref:MFS transporter n=1 Tax=Leifsonia aquatica TaxID=144185 RepID=UPI00384EE571
MTGRSHLPERGSGSPGKRLSGNARRIWYTSAFGVFAGFVGDTAVKLIAVGTLGLTSWQLGLLTASQSSGFLLVGLLVGVLADRLPRRTLMLWAELVRCALYLVLSLVVVFDGSPALAVIFILVLAGSALQAVFEISQQSAVPLYTTSDELSRTNSPIEATRSLMQATGPAIATVIAAFWSPNLSLIVAVVAFALSAGVSFRLPRLAVAADPGRLPVFQSIREGFAFVLAKKDVLAATVAGALFNCAYGVLQTALLFLGSMSGGEVFVGWTLGLAGLGAVVGGLLSRRFRTYGNALAALALTETLSFALVAVSWIGAFSGLNLVFAIPFVLLHIPTAVFNVVAITLRQRRTPADLLGRMTATVRFIMWGALPAGGLVAASALSIGGASAAVGTASVLMLGATIVVLRAWVLTSRRNRQETPGS